MPFGLTVLWILDGHNNDGNDGAVLTMSQELP